MNLTRLACCKSRLDAVDVRGKAGNKHNSRGGKVVEAFEIVSRCVLILHWRTDQQLWGKDRNMDEYNATYETQNVRALGRSLT